VGAADLEVMRRRRITLRVAEAAAVDRTRAAVVVAVDHTLVVAVAAAVHIRAAKRILKLLIFPQACPSDFVPGQAIFTGVSWKA
jgi:hypothetical protein